MHGSNDQTDRRDFMKMVGAGGATLGSISIAGCLGGDSSDGSDERVVEEDLPEDRMVPQDLVYMINTEQYDPNRYQAADYLVRRMNEVIGLDINLDPVEISVMATRRQEGEFDIYTHNWTSNDGDPDSILVDRFHSDGAENTSRFSNDDYDELVMEQRRQTDDDARQELVFECQRILGEQRPENSVIYNEYTKAFNSDIIDPDSVITSPLKNGIVHVWNWTSMEPLNENGQTLITNNWDATDQLNPFHHNARGPSRNNNPTSMLHDFLVRPHPQSLEPTPWAAEDWEYEDDTTIIVTVRNDMLFHDGEPVTIDDIIWTFETILETDPPAYAVFADPIESVEETGDWEVTFHLNEPYAPFLLSTLGAIPILPQHYWEDLMADAGENAPWEITIDDETPVIGSGPFQWGQWDQGERFQMPAFHDHPFAAPNIDMRIQRPLATRDAELEALRQGQYDILDYWFGDQAQLEQTVEENDQLSLVTHLDDGRMRSEVNVSRSPFDDITFRQALNALVMAARPVIIEEIYDGFGEEAVSPINQSLEFWHNPDTPIFGPGEDVAIEILADAGYVWDEEGNIYFPEDQN